MKLPFNLKEPDDYQHYLGVQLYVVYCTHYFELTRVLSWFVRFGVDNGETLTTHRILRVFGGYMPRKKGQNAGAFSTRNYSDRNEGSGNEWKWLNIPLKDEDIAHLEQSDLTLEFLAGCIAALAGDGYGVTIKPVDSGKSICCTIYRPDFPSEGVTVGVSSFGGSVRDALLVGMYKFDEKLGGEFGDVSGLMSGDKQKARFR